MPKRTDISSIHQTPPPRGEGGGGGGSAVMGQGFMSGVVNPSPSPLALRASFASPQGKGSASALISRDSDFLGDHLQHAIHVPQRLVVPEPDHAVAVGFDDFCPASIGSAFGMLPAIEFDGDAEASTGKVRDIATDLALAGKLCAAKLARTQVRPQAPFSIGHVVAQLAREAGQSLFSQ